MLQCRFKETEFPGRYRCEKCGRLTPITSFKPSDIHSPCGVSMYMNSEVAKERSRGLGDTFSKIINRATFGWLKSNKCGGCSKRQAWLNKWWPYLKNEPVD